MVHTCPNALNSVCECDSRTGIPTPSFDGPAAFEESAGFWPKLRHANARDTAARNRRLRYKPVRRIKESYLGRRRLTSCRDDSVENGGMRLELNTRDFVYARQNRLISMGYQRHHLPTYPFRGTKSYLTLVSFKKKRTSGPS
jgi:hypothetical protein